MKRERQDTCAGRGHMISSPLPDDIMHSLYDKYAIIKGNIRRPDSYLSPFFLFYRHPS